MDILTLVLFLAATFIFFLVLRRRKQVAFIENYRFHPAVADKVRDRYPQLSDDQVDLVFQALRDYFLICHDAGRRMIAMPSQVVDVAWHEFILFTKPYQVFCQRGLGRFLHHTPTEAMQTPTVAQEGIKRAWRLSCLRSRIDPEAPAALPLLFAIDADLEIEDGFKYVLDCRDRSSPLYGSGYCAGHIGCAGCAGDAGCSSGCGGGCGGD